MASSEPAAPLASPTGTHNESVKLCEMAEFMDVMQSFYECREWGVLNSMVLLHSLTERRPVVKLTFVCVDKQERKPVGLENVFG